MRRRALRRRFIGIRSVHDFALIMIDTFSQRAAAIAADRLGVDVAADLRPHALAALLAGMTRRHVVDGEEGRPLADWAVAFRQLLGPLAGPESEPGPEPGPGPTAVPSGSAG